MVLKLINYKAKYKDEDSWFSYPNIDIEEGHCLSILGKSGIGKTTLINSLFGLNFQGIRKYDKALFLRKDLNYWGDEKYSYISYMPQFAQDGLNPSKTIGQQIDFVKFNNGSLEDGKINLILQELGLEEDIKKLYPFQISGGMKQRVVLLLSFIKQPKLLILDEPTSALDYFTSAHIMEFLLKRKAEGVSLLMISHDRSFTNRLADEIIVL